MACLLFNPSLGTFAKTSPDSLDLFNEYEVVSKSDRRNKTDEQHLRRLIAPPKGKAPSTHEVSPPLPHQIGKGPVKASSSTSETSSNGQSPRVQPSGRIEVADHRRGGNINAGGSRSGEVAAPRGIAEGQPVQQVYSPRGMSQELIEFNRGNKRAMSLRQIEGQSLRRERGIPTAHELQREIIQSSPANHGGRRDMYVKREVNEQLRRDQGIPTADELPMQVFESLPSVKSGRAQFKDREIWEPELIKWRTEYLDQYGKRLANAETDFFLTMGKTDILIESLNIEKGKVLELLEASPYLNTPEVDNWIESYMSIQRETDNQIMLRDSAWNNLQRVKGENTEAVLTKYFGPLPR